MAYNVCCEAPLQQPPSASSLHQRAAHWITPAERCDLQPSITRHDGGGEYSSSQRASSDCSSDSSFHLCEPRTRRTKHLLGMKLAKYCQAPQVRTTQVLLVYLACPSAVSKPSGQAKATTSLGSSIMSFLKGTYAHEDNWAALQDYQQDQSQHLSISIISGVDTIMAASSGYDMVPPWVPGSETRRSVAFRMNY